MLVRGDGPVFCAGADLKERKGMSDDEVRKRRLQGFAAYDAIEALPMPTIAVVHGAAIGSGSEIAAACDFIVATPEATFSHARGAVGHGRRDAAAAARARQAAGEGPDVHRPQAHGRGSQDRRAGDAHRRARRSSTRRSPRSPQPSARPRPPGLRLAKRCIDQGSELDPRGALATELLAIEENLAQDRLAHPHGRLQGSTDKARHELDAADARRVRCRARRDARRCRGAGDADRAPHLSRAARRRVRRAAKAMHALGVRTRRFRRHPAWATTRPG